MIPSAKRISIKDIAGELGLSTTTVSFVINGKTSSISADTVKKVEKLIKERGFNPNSAARMLRTGKSKTIGLIVEDISNYFFGNMAKVIEQEAHRHGYNIFFSSTESDNNTARALIEKMRNSSVDGLIITATQGLGEDLLKLEKDNLPFVLIDRLIPGVGANYVVIDNYKGAYELTKHLLDNGYRKIGFVSITGGMTQMLDRKRGYTDALSGYKAGVSNRNILEVQHRSNEKTLAAIKKYITANPGIDAIFFSTNYLGVLGIEALQCCRRNIPEDIAVVSFDDNDLFRLMTPGITVAAQPVKELANRSIDMLLSLIKKGQKQGVQTGVVIPPSIIIRQSTPRKISKH